MGDRYILTIECPKCCHKDDDVYYAPTCGFIEWICPKCGEIVDLEKLTGITYEDCSNKELIRQIIEAIK